MAIELYDLAGANPAVRFSPYCWRIRMALAHKGLDCTTIPVRFMDKDKLAFSGQQLVPVIRDGGKTVSDSWDIALYLDEAYPDRPKLFEGPQARALANFVCQWTQMRINLPVLKIVMMDLFHSIDDGDKAYFRTSREQRFGMTLEQFTGDENENRKVLAGELTPLRNILSDQPFLSGDAPAYADYALFGTFMWARNVSPRALLEPQSAIEGWRERMLDLFDGLARQSATSYLR